MLHQLPLLLAELLDPLFQGELFCLRNPCRLFLYGVRPCDIYFYNFGFCNFRLFLFVRRFDFLSLDHFRLYGLDINLLRLNFLDLKLLDLSLRNLFFNLFFFDLRYFNKICRFLLVLFLRHFRLLFGLLFGLLFDLLFVLFLFLSSGNQ